MGRIRPCSKKRRSSAEPGTAAFSASLDDLMILHDDVGSPAPLSPSLLAMAASRGASDEASASPGLAPSPQDVAASIDRGATDDVPAALSPSLLAMAAALEDAEPTPVPTTRSTAAVHVGAVADGASTEVTPADASTDTIARVPAEQSGSTTELMDEVEQETGERAAFDTGEVNPGGDEDQEWLWSGGRPGPNTGDRWGDFDLGMLLGRGGMGLVYRCLQRSLWRRCALKVLPDHIADDEQLRRRFILEARSNSSCDSPNVVGVIGAGEHDGALYFVMEYVDGPNLQQVIDERQQLGYRFGQAEAAALVTQVARGLADARRHGLVHRDIKPSNLIVAKDGRVKIADFGLVKARGAVPITMSGFTVGTPHYISPEQAAGLDVDHRSDLYSLGVVFFELLVGRLPFEADTPEALARLHRTADAPAIHQVDPELDLGLSAVIERLLMKDPVDRYQEPDELVAELERFGPDGWIGGRPRAARPRPLWPMAIPIAAVLAAAVVAGALIVGVATEGPTAAPPPTHGPVVSASVAEPPHDLEALHRQLALVLDRPQPIDRATRDRLHALRDADPRGAVADDLARWERKVLRVDELQEGLAAAALRDGSLDAARAAKAELTGLVGEADPAVLAATAAIDRHERERLRTRIEHLLAGPIDRAAERELGALVSGWSDGVESAPGSTWAAALADHRSAVAEELAFIDRGLMPDAVVPVHAIAAATGRLADRIGEQDRRWRDRADALGRLRAAIAGELEALLRLDPGARHDPVDLDRALATVDRLFARGVLAPAKASGLRRAIRSGLERRQALATVLARLDLTAPVPEGIAVDLAAYEALVPIGDPEAMRWRHSLEARQRLERSLVALDRAQPPSPDAARALERLAALEGESPRVVAWRGKLAEVAALRVRLADLDQGEHPASVVDDLTRLRQLVGLTDPDVGRWAAILDRIATARADLDAALRDRDRPELAIGPLRRLAGLVGRDDEGLNRAAAHLALVLGPASPVWASESGRDKAGTWARLDLGSCALTLRYVPPGRFLMGSPAAERGREDDEIRHQVTLGSPLWLAEVETDQALYRLVTGRSPSRFDDDALPVERVDRADCLAFLAALGERVPGLSPRLPTEAEWEYACRAGAEGAWGGGLDRRGDAFHDRTVGDARSRPVVVGSPNAWGLRNMQGNVWEWCADGYAAYPSTPTVDPLVSGGELGVARGGSWGDQRLKLRAANRLAVDPGLRSAQLGFRIAADVDPASLPDLDQLLAGETP